MCIRRRHEDGADAGEMREVPIPSNRTRSADNMQTVTGGGVLGVFVLIHGEVAGGVACRTERFAYAV